MLAMVLIISGIAIGSRQSCGKVVRSFYGAPGEESQ